MESLTNVLKRAKDEVNCDRFSVVDTEAAHYSDGFSEMLRLIKLAYFYNNSHQENTALAYAERAMHYIKSSYCVEEIKASINMQSASISGETASVVYSDTLDDLLGICACYICADDCIGSEACECCYCCNECGICGNAEDLSEKLKESDCFCGKAAGGLCGCINECGFCGWCVAAVCAYFWIGGLIVALISCL